MNRHFAAAISLSIALLDMSAISAEPVRIMPLGDSRTAGPSARNCYRLYLDGLMSDAGWPYDLVGTQVNHEGSTVVPDTAFDWDHQGMWGWTAAYIRDNPSNGWENEHAAEWVRAERPDIVLALLGTPDMHATNIALAERISGIMQNISAIIDSLRAVDSAIMIILSNLYPTSNEAINADIEIFNQGIEPFIAQKSTAASPIWFVDLWTGFDRTTDLVDHLHANQPGSIKIASRWFDALKPHFDTRVRNAAPCVRGRMLGASMPYRVLSPVNNLPAAAVHAFTASGRLRNSVRSTDCLRVLQPMIFHY